MIRSFDQLVEKVVSSGKRSRVAVAWAQDEITAGALARGIELGFIHPVMIGLKHAIEEICKTASIDLNRVTIIDVPDEMTAAETAVRMVRNGEADIVMKGLVGTDKFLRAVMNKETGLLPAGSVMSYACAIELPQYHKLLFVTDTAVIPFPNLEQKIAMAKYSIALAKAFGIEKPAIALIGASEKVSNHFPNSLDYKEMCRMASEGSFGDCIMDGPLDLFLATDPESVRIKGVPTPINGDADILLFPDLESCNPFYKGLMRFAGGELAGLIQGTTKPVVVMSRSESENSKFYCVALAALMASQSENSI